MDRARQYTTVKDFERRNPQEVEYHDAAYDHQMLLNETERPSEVKEVALGGTGGVAGRPWAAAKNDAEASKLVTETWEEYAVRVPVREQNLNRYFAEQAAADAAEKLKQEKRAKTSTAAVERLMNYQNEYNTKHYRPNLHTLRTDFDAVTGTKMYGERVALEEFMLESRGRLAKTEEAPSRRAIEAAAHDSFERVLAILEQQRQERLAEERRRQEEQLAREAARKAEEDRRKAAEAAAELKRRQEEAEAKQQEQKRRNDERKAKARAEREQRSKGRASVQHGGSGAAALGLVREGRTDSMDMTLAGQTVAGLDTTLATTGGGAPSTPRAETASLSENKGPSPAEDVKTIESSDAPTPDVALAPTPDAQE